MDGCITRRRDYNAGPVPGYYSPLIEIAGKDTLVYQDRASYKDGPEANLPHYRLEKTGQRAILSALPAGRDGSLHGDTRGSGKK